jgi:low temperature requirement protein LtrA
VAYAVALEEALAHPTEALPAAGRLAVALGLALFLGGTAFAMWRTTAKVPVLRLVVTLAAAGAVYLLAEVPPVVTLSVAFAGVAMIAGHDEWRAQRLSTEPA